MSIVKSIVSVVALGLPLLVINTIYAVPPQGNQVNHTVYNGSSYNVTITDNNSNAGALLMPDATANLDYNQHRACGNNSTNQIALYGFDEGSYQLALECNGEGGLHFAGYDDSGNSITTWMHENDNGQVYISVDDYRVTMADYDDQSVNGNDDARTDSEAEDTTTSYDGYTLEVGSSGLDGEIVKLIGLIALAVDLDVEVQVSVTGDFQDGFDVEVNVSVVESPDLSGLLELEIAQKIIDDVDVGNICDDILTFEEASVKNLLFIYSLDHGEMISIACSNLADDGSTSLGVTRISDATNALSASGESLSNDEVISYMSAMGGEIVTLAQESDGSYTVEYIGDAEE